MQKVSFSFQALHLGYRLYIESLKPQIQKVVWVHWDLFILDTLGPKDQKDVFGSRFMSL